MSVEINVLVQDFTSQIVALIQAEATERARAAILGAFAESGVTVKRGPGRPPGSGRKVLQLAGIKPRAVSDGRRLHGQYIGRLRSLKGRDRARVQAVRNKKGPAEAIKLADRLLRS